VDDALSGQRVGVARQDRGWTVTENRLHRVVTSDGTEIAGEVRGQGAALLLVHGGLGPMTHPDAVAADLLRFFGARLL